VTRGDFSARRPLAAAAFYDHVAPAYDRSYALPAATTQLQAGWLARKLPGGRVLDLGCGTGRMLLPLARLGLEPVGLDISPAMLALAGARQPSPPLVMAQAGRGLPFAAHSFASVISLHSTLCHLTGPGELEDLAVEVRRVLVPGGVLVAELPHPRSYPRPGRPGAWRRFRRDLTCRRLAPGLEEMRLEQEPEVSTLVRVLEVEEVGRWLAAYSRVELYPGFSGGRFRRRRGDVMVVRAVV